MPKLVLNTVEKIAGTTLWATWYASGAVPSQLTSLLRDAAGNVVDSVAGVASGDGYYYALHQLPSSRQWLVNEWYAYVNVNTYKSLQLVKLIDVRVDTPHD